MDDTPEPEPIVPPWVAMLQAQAEQDPRKHQEEP